MIKSIDIKTEIRTLKSSWTPELAKDLKSFYSFDSFESFGKIIAKELRVKKRKNFINKILN